MEPPDPASEPVTRFDLVNDIVEAAVDLPPEQREAFVARHCERDEALRHSVLRLLSACEKMGDFLCAPPLRAPEIRPGEVLAGRFRVVEKLGEGGMGSVYLAEDRELGEVALKTVRAELRGDGETVERFRSEIRLSRGVGHRNVCPVFELFPNEPTAAGPVTFFTMKYLKGETLAGRLARGPMELAEAIRLARGIAAGLDALHAEGIVHRDLKPGNIILMPEQDGTERPVITDFGLARTAAGADADSSKTGASQILGSPDYMAPEQFLSAAVTKAADIYAFGLIVYEMVSGARPFPKEDMLRAAVRRAREDAPPLRSVAKLAPARLERGVARALAREVRERPASAGEVVDFAPGDPGVPRLGLKKPLSRRLVLGAAGGATILSCIYAIRRYMSREAPLPESPKLMLTACTHMPGDKDREIAATVDTLLRTQLQQSAHVSLLSKAQMQEAWERITGKRDRFPESIEPAKARHTAMRAGAQFVLFGGLTQVGDTKALQLDLELLGSDPATPRRTWPQSFAANRDSDLPSAVFEGTAWLRQVTGETAQALSMHQRHPQDLTTGSWQALLEFQRAEDAWSAGAGDAALLHLRTALDLDPEFALAAARMADILESLHRRDEGLPYYNRAAELIRGKNLTDRESLRIAGLFALDTGQFSEAERVFTRFALEYPKDPLPLFYKATAVDCLGRGDEALQLAQNAFSMEPTSYAYIMLRAIFLLNRGQFREAEEDLGHAARLKTGDWTDQLRSALAMAHGDLPEVWRSLEKMRTSGSLPYRSRAYGFEACIMAERGDLGAAQRLLKDGMDFDRRMGTGAQAEFTRNRMFAQIALRQGEKRKAIGICRLMLNGDPALENTMSVGCLLAQAGETAAARRCLPAEMPAWPTYLHWQQRLKGELALSEGRPLEALASMKAAPPSHIHYEWPEYVARAAIAARDMATLRGCLMPLLTNPARYWLQGDTTGPGFIRWACETAERAELPPKELVLARSLKKLLNKSVS